MFFSATGAEKIWGSLKSLSAVVKNTFFAVPPALKIDIPTQTIAHICKNAITMPQYSCTAVLAHGQCWLAGTCTVSCCVHPCVVVVSATAPVATQCQLPSLSLSHTRSHSGHFHTPPSRIIPNTSCLKSSCDKCLRRWTTN